MLNVFMSAIKCLSDYVILPSHKHKIVSQQFKDISEFIFLTS